MNRAASPILRILVVACVAFSGCKKGTPDESRPWVVWLDEAPTRQAAEKLAEEYAERQPGLAEHASVLSHQVDGMARHLVVSRGFESEQDAAKLARDLAGSKPLRLAVVDTRTLNPVEGAEQEGITPPEDSELFEKLASLLPDPGSLEIESFLLMSQPERAKASALKPHGRAGVPAFSRAFGSFGWKATAEAGYLHRGAGGSERILLYVGWQGGQDSLRLVYNFLLEHVVPTDEEWEQIRLERKKRWRRQRKRRARRRTPAPEESVPAEPKEPPKPIPRNLPWGASAVHVVERVGFVKRESARPDTPARTAWLGWLPDRQGVILVLFPPDLEAQTTQLLTAVGLGQPHGLSFSPELASVWKVVPEVCPEGERLASLGRAPFRESLDRKRRKSNWGQAHGGRPLRHAGYRSDRSGWQVTWLGLESEVDATMLFDSAFVAPRQEMIQKTVLQARKAVRYDVGISMHEVGDVEGWYLRGADRGRLRELYFRKNRTLWLLQTPEKGSPPLELADLLGRADLLQIWE